jgi:hypothetical protein
MHSDFVFHSTPHVFHAQVKMTSQDVVVTISDSDLAAMEAEAPRCLCSALNGCQNPAICGSRSARTQRVLFHHRFCRSCFDQGFLVPMDSIWEVETDSDLYRKRNVNRNGCNNHTNELLWETLTIGSRSIKGKTTKYVLFKNGLPTGLKSEDLQQLHPMYNVDIPTLNVKVWVRLIPRQHSMYPVADPSFTSTMEASFGASSQPPAQDEEEEMLFVAEEHALSPTVQTTPHLLATTAPSPYPGYRYAFPPLPPPPSHPPSPPESLAPSRGLLSCTMVAIIAACHYIRAMTLNPNVNCGFMVVINATNAALLGLTGVRVSMLNFSIYKWYYVLLCTAGTGVSAWACVTFTRLRDHPDTVAMYRTTWLCNAMTTFLTSLTMRTGYAAIDACYFPGDPVPCLRGDNVGAASTFYESMAFVGVMLVIVARRTPKVW